MSRRLLLCLVLLSLVLPAGLAAQRDPRIELTPHVGYLMSWSVSYPLGSVDVKDNFSYGGSIGFRVRPGKVVELDYNYFDSDVTLRGVSGTEDLGKMATHYVQVAANNEFGYGRNVRPYGTGSLGMTIYDPADTQYGTQTRFSFGLGAGVKVMNKTDRFGLRLQGKFMFNFLSGGMAMGCGTAGCVGGVSGTGQVQFEPMAGLIIAF
jgi:hypothetical protein